MSGAVSVAPGATAGPVPTSTCGNDADAQPVWSTRAAASIVTVPLDERTQPVGARNVTSSVTAGAEIARGARRRLRRRESP